MSNWKHKCLCSVMGKQRWSAWFLFGGKEDLYGSGQDVGGCLLTHGKSQIKAEVPDSSDNPLQYSCLENPMDCGAWGATVHGVTKSQT